MSDSPSPNVTHTSTHDQMHSARSNSNQNRIEFEFGPSFDPSLNPTSLPPKVHSASQTHPDTLGNNMSCVTRNDNVASSSLSTIAKSQFAFDSNSFGAAADFTKCSALPQCTGEIGSISCAHSHGLTSNSSNNDIQPSIHMDQILTTSVHSRAAGRKNDQTNFVPPTPTSPQHLANSSSSAAIPLASTHPSNPIATNTQPNRFILSSHNSSSSPLLSSSVVGSHLVDHQQSHAKVHVSKYEKSNSTLASLFAHIQQSPSLPSTASPIHMSDAASSSSSPNLSQFDTSCHCLVVDVALLRDVDRSTFDSLIKNDAEFQQNDLAISTRTFLQQTSGDAVYDASGVIAARITLAQDIRTLHVIFNSHSALAAALARFDFFVRCGTQTKNLASDWHKPLVHGVTRDKLHELIKLTLIPSQGFTIKQAEIDLRAKLAALNISFASMWPSASSVSFRNQSRDGRSTFTFNILQRLIDDENLQKTIVKLHQVVDIGGSKLRVHAPNNPSLSRCTQCNALGHSPNACLQYAGKPIRLLFKEPVGISFANQLAASLQSSSAYVGSDYTEIWNRRVTLLFREEESDEEIIRRLQTIMPEIISKLQSAPSFVSVNFHSRRSECKECGSTKKPHECPFNHSANFRVGGSNIGSARVQGSAQAIRVQSSIINMDGMCKSWHKMKTCPRLEKGQVCKFTHPASHEPRGCDQFSKNGKCERVNCEYAHYEAPSVAASSSSIAAAVVASSHAPSRQSVAASVSASEVAHNNSVASSSGAASSARVPRRELFPTVGDAVAVPVPTSSSVPVAAAAAASSFAPVGSPTKKRDRPQSAASSKTNSFRTSEKMIDDSSAAVATPSDDDDVGFQPVVKRGRKSATANKLNSKSTTTSSRNISSKLPENKEEIEDKMDEGSTPPLVRTPAASPTRGRASSSAASAAALSTSASNWSTMSPSRSTSSTTPIIQTNSKAKKAASKGGSDTAAAASSSSAHDRA